MVSVSVDLDFVKWTDFVHALTVSSQYMQKKS